MGIKYTVRHKCYFFGPCDSTPSAASVTATAAYDKGSRKCSVPVQQPFSELNCSCFFGVSSSEISSAAHLDKKAVACDGGS